MSHRVELKKPLRVADPVKDAEVPHPILVESSQIGRHVSKRLAKQFRMTSKVSYLLGDAARDSGVEPLEVPLEAGGGDNAVGLTHAV